ncbi:MAG: SPOR domain-containing protein [Bacteroidota bacterium]
MKSIDRLVFSLLHTHECVIIPSFGGFIVKTKSARFDFEKGTATPPFKELSFNLKLNDNDGQLIKYCSSENNLSYLESESMIRQQVIEWNQRIDQGHRLNLESIGFFWKDLEGNVQFEQDRSFNLLLASFGLELIEFIPTISEELEITTSQIPMKVERSKLLKYAAAAAVILPIAFYSYWIPVKTPALESGLISYRDFNPLETSNKGHYHFSAVSSESYSLKNLEVNPEITPGKNILQDEAKSDANGYENSNDPVITPATMYLIAGCFANSENANRYVTKLKTLGFDPQILHEGVLYKISIGAAFTQEGLIPVVNKAHNASIDCWILKP